MILMMMMTTTSGLVVLIELPNLRLSTSTLLITTVYRCYYCTSTPYLVAKPITCSLARGSFMCEATPIAKNITYSTCKFLIWDNNIIWNYHKETYKSKKSFISLLYVHSGINYKLLLDLYTTNTLFYVKAHLKCNTKRFFIKRGLIYNDLIER